MKSIFRLYARTSKGNDSQLLQQLTSFNLKPKYDPHLQSFYFASTFKDLFNLSFYALSLESLYVQIGQRFPLIDEEQIKIELEKLPIKNYLQIQRNLVQRTSLRVMIRECSQIPSENVLISLLRDSIEKEIIRKEFHQKIAAEYRAIQDVSRKAQFGHNYNKVDMVRDIEYREMKEIVEKKWFDDDQEQRKSTESKIQALIQQIRQLQSIAKDSEAQVLRKNSVQRDLVPVHLQQQNKLLVAQKKAEVQMLSEQTEGLSPVQGSSAKALENEIVFYARKNRARVLLKVNKDSLYKHGFKKEVNYGPIRESIASSILRRSKLLERALGTQEKIKIWDPMCGSGTFGLVAATMFQKIPVRKNIGDLFRWQQWPIYREQYLEEFWAEEGRQSSGASDRYQIVLSDRNLKSLNSAIANFQRLRTECSLSHKTSQGSERASLVPFKTASCQYFQILPEKIGCVLGDFEDVVKSLVSEGPERGDAPRLNIITNLPYLHGRSEEKYPLNQLHSLYRRFSRMISAHKPSIENVFVVVDRNTNDWNHFLSVSGEAWDLVADYVSGGKEISLYAWSRNAIQSHYHSSDSIGSTPATTAVPDISKLSPQERQVFLQREKSISSALVEYRQKMKSINLKYFNLPAHLKKTVKGWRRIKEKRRQRHLQAAYEIFAKRREQMVAFRQYQSKKLEIRLLKRGSSWKRRNLQMLPSTEALETLAPAIKREFEAIINEASKRQQERELRIQEKKAKQGTTTALKESKWGPPQNQTQNKKAQSRSASASKARPGPRKHSNKR